MEKCRVGGARIVVGVIWEYRGGDGGWLRFLGGGDSKRIGRKT